jgi:hypothetical protein
MVGDFSATKHQNRGGKTNSLYCPGCDVSQKFSRIYYINTDKLRNASHKKGKKVKIRLYRPCKNSASNCIKPSIKARTCRLTWP